MKQKRITRWVMGYEKPLSIECLQRSIDSYLKFHDSDVLICHNCNPECLSHLPYKLYDQRKEYAIKPEGVAWKLYPPRVDINSHELIIDNDIVFNEKIEEIESFFNSNSTIMLEDLSRNYGKFEKHVPKEYNINSGIFGFPPNFDFENYVKFYVNKDWEINADGVYKESKTFDEQGVVAASLLSHHSKIIISNKVITICENKFKSSKGMHFVGLNRTDRHQAFEDYKKSIRKIYL